MLPTVHVCDGRSDCDDGTDECFCDTSPRKYDPHGVWKRRCAEKVLARVLLFLFFFQNMRKSEILRSSEDISENVCDAIAGMRTLHKIH